MQSKRLLDEGVYGVGASRRTFLADLGMGFWGLAIDALLERDGVAWVDPAERATSPDGRPHFRPRAKRVIWLMMCGGVSHLESFDPKPELNRHAGKTLAESPYRDLRTSPYLKRERRNDLFLPGEKDKLYPMQIGFQKGGASGIEVSDWWPHVRSCVDRLVVIRSMWTGHHDHAAQIESLTAHHPLDGCFPTIGAWIHYGLGSLSDNLPQFISIGAALNGSSHFFTEPSYLGPEHAGTILSVDPKKPLLYARPELPVSPAEQIAKARVLNRLNREASVEYPGDEKLKARIKSYELAFRMQTAVPEVMRFDEESVATQRLYGLDHEVTRPFGQHLLATRRLMERGVRFVQVFHGGGGGPGAWDAHDGLRKNHSKLCAQVDRPIAGLLKDLEQRGLLDDTIVVWATEFGRSPCVQGKSGGRQHNNQGFSMWMAGGGLKRGIVHGATDELGLHAVEHSHHITDVHATLCRLLGLDPRRLDVPGHKRLEVEYGRPIEEIIA